MKMSKKSKLVLLSLLFLPLLSACSESEAYDYSVKRVELAQAKKISMVDTLSFSADLSGARETLLSTKIPGKIERIDAEIGDVFAEGEVLAYLSGEENFVQRNMSEQNYQNSLMLLENTRAQMEQNVSGAEAALVMAKENLNLAKKGEENNTTVSPERINEARLQLDLARQERERLEDNFSQKREDIYDGMKSLIAQANILASNILQYLYTMNEENLPDPSGHFDIADKFMSNSDQAEREAAHLIRDEFKPAFYVLEDFYGQKIKGQNPEKAVLIEGVGVATETLEKAKNALQAMNDVVNFSVSHWELGQKQLSDYSNELTRLRSQTESLLLSQDAGVNIGLLGVEQALQNLDLEEKNQLDLADKQIVLAEQKLATLQRSTEASYDDHESRVAIAEAQVKQAEEALEIARRQLDLQVQMSQSQVDANRGLLEMASVNVDNTRLKMPYAGVVVEKLIDEGTVVNAGTPVLKVADNSSFKLIIYVPESLIAYFQPGQQGTAHSVALKEKQYPAVVERISPQSEEDTKKVKVELSLRDVDDYLKIGMEMKFQVDLERDEEITTVPSRAVFDFYGDEMVYVYKEGKVHRKAIKVGMVGSDNVQVTSGISEGDKVVVAGINNLRDGEEVELIE